MSMSFLKKMGNWLSKAILREKNLFTDDLRRLMFKYASN